MSTEDTHADEFRDLDDAFALWREDAERTAEQVDVHGALADRIVAGVAQPDPSIAPMRAARWYAVAAMLLIGVGVAGTLLTRPTHQDTSRTLHQLGDLDEELINNFVVIDPAYEPGLGR